MKFVSWNVNGIRACLTKGFEERFQQEQTLPDDHGSIPVLRKEQELLELHLRRYRTYLYSGYHCLHDRPEIHRWWNDFRCGERVKTINKK